MRLLSLALLLLAPLAAAGPAGAGRVDARASAVGIELRLPNGAIESGASAAAPPEGAGFEASFVHGDAVASGPLETVVWASRTDRADASAAASVSTLSLFAGEVTLESATVEASAGASQARADGSVGLSALEGLLVLGVPIEPVANARVPLGDWGYAVVLEQGVVRSTEGASGFRGTVVGLHVYLTADHAGLPAGTEVFVARAEAAAEVEEEPDEEEPDEEEPAPPPPTPEAEAAPPAKTAPRAEETSPRLEETTPEQEAAEHDPVAPPAEVSAKPPPIVRTPPPEIRARLTEGGFVFPVYGVASFGDDFAAARASTGWHHGNDVFAPLGAPVLAAASGELFLVGWNDVGGHRLWLRDDEGNEFYYAHLSAYSPLAVSGSRVRAGDVLGFVGTSGDAEGTPPHLHFEIHPTELSGLGYDGVVDPYDYLLAWRRLDDRSFARAAAVEPGSAPPPAAVLLGSEDISTVVALDPEALGRTLSAPDLLAESRRALVPAVGPSALEP